MKILKEPDFQKWTLEFTCEKCKGEYLAEEEDLHAYGDKGNTNDNDTVAYLECPLQECRKHRYIKAKDLTMLALSRIDAKRSPGYFPGRD